MVHVIWGKGCTARVITPSRILPLLKIITGKFRKGTRDLCIQALIMIELPCFVKRLESSLYSNNCNNFVKKILHLLHARVPLKLRNNTRNTYFLKFYCSQFRIDLAWSLLSWSEINWKPRVISNGPYIYTHRFLVFHYLSNWSEIPLS